MMVQSWLLPVFRRRHMSISSHETARGCERDIDPMLYAVIHGFGGSTR